MVEMCDDSYIVDKHEGKYYDRTKLTKYKKENLKMSGKYSKICAKCGETKLITADNFYRDKYRADGFMPICKECKKKEYQKKKTNLKKKDIIIINPENIEVGVIKNEKETIPPNIVSKFTESSSKLYNISDNKITCTYEWVKSLSEDKRKMLDQKKITEKIIEELFGKK